MSEKEVIVQVQELCDTYQITSLAVCFINSYKNPVHELQVQEIVSREFPGLSISTSADIFPAVREYERWTTNVVNAYTQSIFKTYLNEFESWLKAGDFAGKLSLLVSDGGTVNIDIARQYPVRMLASGSAATMLLCRQVSLKYNQSDLLMFDMGGTTTKLGIIKNGAAQKCYDIEVGRIYRHKKGSGLPVFTPVFDQVEVACGGCSIVDIDQRGVLQIGPESMGALPGPACFDFGGDNPTPTDANLLLGFYGADTFLGGELSCDIKLAEQTIVNNLSDRLEINALRSAWGIYETVNESILASIKTYSAERGIDYRECQLLATGGAAATHAMAIARKLGIENVVIPLASGVASAVGLLGASISFELLQSYRIALGELTLEDFVDQFKQLEKRVLSIISPAGEDNTQTMIVRQLDMRYQGQGFEVEIILPADTDLVSLYPVLADHFNQAYEKQFFTRFTDYEIEIIAWKVEIIHTESTSIDKYTLEDQQSGTAARQDRRHVFSPRDDSYVEWPVYQRHALEAGEKLIGPMLIEDNETTSVFFQGDIVEVDADLNLIASPDLSHYEQ